MVLFRAQHITFSERDKVGICFRMDKESVVTTEYRKQIMDIVNDATYCFDMHADEPIMGLKRNEYIQKYIDMVSGLKYVITDRLHGMIFAAITSTPWIALDNYNHKIRACSVTLEGLDYIKYIESIDEIEEKIKYLLNNKFDKYNNEFAIRQFEQIMREEIE